MRLASVSLAGVDLAESTAKQTSTMNGYTDAGDMRLGRRVPAHGYLPPSPDPALDGEEEQAKWPAWKSTLFVIGFCGLFWGGVIWLALRLLG